MWQWKRVYNGHFHNFFELNGMIFWFSCPHTSPQNRKAEIKIYTINNIIHTLLTRATLLPHFWHHALHMTTYFLNTLSIKKLALKFSIKKVCHTLTLKSLVVFVAILFYLPLKINLLSRSTTCAFFCIILQIKEVINVMGCRVIK